MSKKTETKVRKSSDSSIKCDFKRPKDFIEFYKFLCEKNKCIQLPSIEKNLPIEVPIATPKVLPMKTAKSSPGDNETLKNDLILRRIYAIPESDKVETVKFVYFKNVIVENAMLFALTEAIRFQPNLLNLEFNNCLFESHAIPFIAQTVGVSQLTILNMDGCPLQERDYYKILQFSKTLRMLSLRHSSIDDFSVKFIAAELIYPKPAEKLLQVLNLSSNRITDLGAMFLARALRTNRNMQCLTLADNWIEDQGCYFIADALKDFCLSSEEIMIKRKRNYKFVMKKQEIFEEYVKLKTNSVSNLSIDTKGDSILNSLKYSSFHDYITTELSVKYSELLLKLKDVKPYRIYQTLNKTDLAIIDEIIERNMEEFNDPLKASETIYKDENLHCKGNFTLRRLNLAYNKLSFASTQYFLEAVDYQLSTGTTGISKIILEGNKTALTCPEYQILLQNLAKVV